MAPKGGKETPIPKSMFDQLISKARDWFGPGDPPTPTAPVEAAKGRQFDFPYGVNLSTRPRSESGETAIGFEVLRRMAEPAQGGLDLVRLAIEKRKNQMAAQAWHVKRRDGGEDDDRVKSVNLRMRRPDGVYVARTWQRMLLEDLLVIDAPAIYLRPAGNGIPFLEVLDGSTIKRLVDITGRTPLPPDPAYTQVLKGVTAAEFTFDELVYAPRNPRPHRFYGYSPVEQVVNIVDFALKRALTQTQHFTEGNIPEALVGVPMTWTTDQIQEFQAYWDLLMSEDEARLRHMKFVPGGMVPTFTRQQVLKDETEEWLARIICYAFDLSPQALVKEVNRATAETSKEAAQEEGLEPIKLWFKDTFDEALERGGCSDLELAYKDEEIADPKTKATVVSLATGGKAWMTVKEAREQYGLKELTAEDEKELQPPPEPSPFGGGEPGGGAPPFGGPPAGEEDDEASKGDAEAGRIARRVLRPPPDRDRPLILRETAALKRKLERAFAGQRRAALAWATAQLARVDGGPAIPIVFGKVRVAGEVVRADKKKDDLDGIIDSEEQRKEYERHHRRVAEDGVDEGVKQLDLDPTKAVDEMLAQAHLKAIKWSQLRSAELVTQIDETTRTALRNLVGFALEEGLSAQDLAEEIEKMGMFSEARAEMIARTELAFADVKGTLIGWNESGVVAEKQWIVAQDEVCDLCLELHGQRVALDDDFELDGEVVRDPPLHPNCRCDVLPVFPDEVEERVARDFNPDQPRDEHGRWTDGGGSVAALTGDEKLVLEAHKAGLEKQIQALAEAKSKATTPGVKAGLSKKINLAQKELEATNQKLFDAETQDAPPTAAEEKALDDVTKWEDALEAAQGDPDEEKHAEAELEKAQQKYAEILQGKATAPAAPAAAPAPSPVKDVAGAALEGKSAADVMKAEAPKAEKIAALEKLYAQATTPGVKAGIGKKLNQLKKDGGVEATAKSVHDQLAAAGVATVATGGKVGPVDGDGDGMVNDAEKADARADAEQGGSGASDALDEMAIDAAAKPPAPGKDEPTEQEKAEKQAKIAELETKYAQATTPGVKAGIKKKINILKGEMSGGSGNAAPLTPKQKAEVAQQLGGKTASAIPTTVEQIDVPRSKIHEHLGFVKAGEWESKFGGPYNAHHASLTGKQASALGSYKGSGYGGINGSLRHNSVDGYNADTIKSIEDAISFAPPLAEDTYMWRGFRYADLAKDPVKFLQKNGGLYHDNGFVSTSLHSVTSMSFSGSDKGRSVLVRVKVPAGTRSVHWYSEHEHLLQRDSTFKINRVLKTSDGFTVLDGEYVGSSPAPLSERGYKAGISHVARAARAGDRFTWDEDDASGFFFHAEELEPDAERVARYSEDQPRDDNGRWTGGGGTVAAYKAPTASLSPREGDSVEVLQGKLDQLMKARAEATTPGVKSGLKKKIDAVNAALDKAKGAPQPEPPKAEEPAVADRPAEPREESAPAAPAIPDPPTFASAKDAETWTKEHLGVSKASFLQHTEAAQITVRGLVRAKRMGLDLPPEVEIRALHPKYGGLTRTGGGKPTLFTMNANSSMLKPEVVEQTFKSGWISTPDPDHIVLHELGHVNHHNALLKESAAGVTLPFAPKTLGGSITPTERYVAAKVSRYGSSHRAEFVAETFVGLATGKTYPPEVMDLYAKLYGPQIKT